MPLCRMEQTTKVAECIGRGGDLYSFLYLNGGWVRPEKKKIRGILAKIVST